MPDATQVLTQDHRKVERLFDRYQGGDVAVIPEICNELLVHTDIEEEVAYPALDEVNGGRALKDEAEREHQQVEDAVKRLQQMNPDSADAAELMTTIIDGVTHHVEEEERELLPRMERELGADRMAVIGEELLVAKLRLLLANGGLHDLTRDELYEIAQGVGLAGRSEMNKEELISALER